MQTLDPYKPPTSDFKGDPILAAGELHYSSFWQRVGAGLVDFLIVLPLVLLDAFIGGKVRLLPLYMLVPTQLISIFMLVYMVRRYGGGPGKLTLGLRIVMLDGSPITMKATLLRYAPIWIMSTLTAVGTIIGLLAVPDSAFGSLGYVERGMLLNEHMPGWTMAVNSLLQLYMLASLVTILANKKRRAIHDFIAGTVVIRK
jgi:uncharacterized RDD family membrane protein YckC